MVKLDIDTLNVFDFHKEAENRLYFKGHVSGSFCSLNKLDNANDIQPDYYKIVNPTRSPIIDKIYVFKNLKDALMFYSTRKTNYFLNSLIVVTSNCTEQVTEYLKDHYVFSRKVKRKIICHHIPDDYTLIIFQINLVNSDLYYNIKYNIKDVYLNIANKTNETTLDFRQSLAFQDILLGTKSKNYFFANRILKTDFLNSFLII